jgi:Ni/Co efflux regulator RcnB
MKLSWFRKNRKNRDEEHIQTVTICHRRCYKKILPGYAGYRKGKDNRVPYYRVEMIVNDFRP